MRIAVFGMGYVGAVSSACLAELGHEVIGVDVSPLKVKLINDGTSPVVEKGLNELIQAQIAAGRLRATTDTWEAVRNSDVAFISVGTPSAANGEPSMSAVEAVVEQIGRVVRTITTPYAVVMRSTVPPGTNEERVIPSLTRHSGRKIGDGLEVCSNPEFLREGSALKDFSAPPFTLIGASGEAGYRMLEEIYAKVDAAIIRADLRVAESVKYLCNVFHAVKITFANEAGALLRELGVDSREALRIFALDKVLNISPAYLRPGFAFGGSCLPKDTRAFMSFARTRDVELPFLSSVLASNQRHIERALELVSAQGRKPVALFGLAFKPGTDDLRESPLVVLAERLIGKGFPLKIFDRHVETARLIGANREYIEREIPHFEKLLTPAPEQTLAGAEIIVLGHASPDVIQEIVKRYQGQMIVDLTGSTELQQLGGANYHGICW